MLPAVVVPSAFAALRQVLSPPLRRILWRALGMTVLLLLLVWVGLTKLVGSLLSAHPLSADYPVLDSTLVFLAGAGLFVGFAYILPIVSAFVAGLFLDEAAEVVERTDFPADPPGRALTLGTSILSGLRFAGLALAVNAVALCLLLVPGVNVVAFFGANAYLFGREYFEMAAARFGSAGEAAHLRRAHGATVLAAGALMAGLLMIPILNLMTPLFGIALMVHVRKRIVARRGRGL